MKSLQELKALLEKQLPWEMDESTTDCLLLKSVNGAIFTWRSRGENVSITLDDEVEVFVDCKLDPSSSRRKRFDPLSQTLAREIEAFVGAGGPVPGSEYHSH